MFKTILTLVMLSAALLSKAANDTTRILFIGNSFTYTYDVPDLVKQLAAEAGFPIKFVMHAPGGISVGDVAQGTQAHMNNPLVYDYIRSDDWDYVILQDNQGRFIGPYGGFPSTAVSKVMEGHLQIRDSVKYHHPCAHMLWFAGWAFKNGYTGIANTGEELINNIYGNYTFLNNTAHEIIAPIGVAWKRSIHTLPQTDLWGPDETHQSLAGSYLTASVLFTTMFRTNPELLSYNAGLDIQVAKTLRKLAYQSVMDSIIVTRLYTSIPLLQLSGNLLTASTGYAGYKWFKDGVLINSGTSNTQPTSGTGCYQVVTTAQNSCTGRSVALYLGNATGIASQRDMPLTISPVPAHNEVTIEPGIPDNSVKTITLSDAVGRILYCTTTTDAKIKIPLAQLSDGYYFISLKMHAGLYRGKFIKSGE